MKQIKFISLLTAFLLNSITFYGNTFILESKTNLEYISIFNAKTKESKKIISWRSGNYSFIFEAENISDTYIKLSKNSEIKLYSIDEKKTTNWINLSENELISLKQLFLEMMPQQIKPEDFIIKSFITRPITQTNSNLRNYEKLNFYVPQNTTFLSKEELSISWNSGYKINELNIVDISNLKYIYTTSQFNDTILRWAKIPEEIRKKFTNKTNYLLEIKSNQNEFIIQSSYLWFNIDSAGTTNHPNIMYFLSAENIDFDFEKYIGTVKIKVLDCDNNLIQKISLKMPLNDDFKLNNSLYSPQKYYALEIRNKKKVYRSSFLFILNQEEYKTFIKILNQ